MSAPRCYPKKKGFADGGMIGGGSSLDVAYGGAPLSSMSAAPSMEGRAASPGLGGTAVAGNSLGGMGGMTAQPKPMMGDAMVAAPRPRAGFGGGRGMGMGAQRGSLRQMGYADGGPVNVKKTGKGAPKAASKAKFEKPTTKGNVVRSFADGGCVNKRDMKKG